MPLIKCKVCKEGKCIDDIHFFDERTSICYECIDEAIKNRKFPEELDEGEKQ